jgi:hypothetical protein
MPRRENLWADLLIAMTGVLIGSASQHRHRISNVRQPPQQQKDTARHNQQPASHMSNELAALNPPSAQPSPEENQHRAYERDFWRRQIGVAKWLNGITACAAVVGIIGLIFVYLSLGETKRAGDIASKTLIEANRAWIAPEGAIAKGDVVGGNDDISAKVFYTNIGKGPATRINSVYAWGTTDNKENASDAIIVGPNNTCVSLEPKNDGTVVFPTKLLHQETSLPRQSISPSVKANKEVIFLQGCVIYETMKEIHKSWFCFIIYRDGTLAGQNTTALCGDGQGAE